MNPSPTPCAGHCVRFIWSVVPLLTLLVPRLPVFCQSGRCHGFRCRRILSNRTLEVLGGHRIGGRRCSAPIGVRRTPTRSKRGGSGPARDPRRNPCHPWRSSSRLWPSPSLHATASSARDLRDAPAAWLAGRERGIGALVGTGILLPSLGILLSRVFSNPATTTHLGMTLALQLSLPYAGGLLLVAGSGRFFGEARRSGGFELLLCTPLSTQALVHEAWFRIRRFLFLGGVVSMAVFALGAARFLAGFGIWECLVEGVQVALGAHLVGGLSAGLVVQRGAPPHWRRPCPPRWCWRWLCPPSPPT